MNRSHLHLEFAPQARTVQRAPLAWLLLSVLALGLCVVALGRDLAEQARQSQQWAALGEAPRQPSAASQPTQKRDPLEQARVQFVRKTTRSMATPWADLLAALEAKPADVALLSVEPSANKRRVMLTAETATATQMLAYLHTLQSDSRLSDVVLVSHKLQATAPGTPLRFQVEAHWGDAP